MGCMFEIVALVVVYAGFCSCKIYGAYDRDEEYLLPG